MTKRLPDVYINCMARKRTQRKTARVKNPSFKKYYGKFSPVLIIVIVVAIAVLAGAGYFLFGKGGKGASPLGSKGNSFMGQKVKESDFAYIEDELLRKHYAAQANQTKFKVNSASSGFGGTSAMEYDMQGDTYKYRTTQSGEGIQSDMIVIGDTTYIKDFKDGKWWKQTQKPEEENTEIQDQIEEYTVDPVEEQTQFQSMQYNNLGEGACGDLTCYKYEEVDPSNADSGKRTFWFDTKDYLLRKDMSEYGEFSSTNEYFYDDISVKAPSPTKDVPEGRNIYEYMISGGNEPATEGIPSQDEIDAMMKQYQESGDVTFPASDDLYDSGEY